MKIAEFVSRKAILAFVLAASFSAQAEKIKKHTDADGFEDWYWTTTVKVSRGAAHTFWIKELTENSAITDIEVYSEYTYNEDGETYDGAVYPSESTERENSAGGWDKYILLTVDDWDWVPSSKNSFIFTVKVSGWGDEGYSSEDLSFKFGHADGDSEYPGEQEEVIVAPKGTQDNPQSIKINETARPDVDATLTDCPLAEDLGEIFYIKTPNLVAGRKYFFGIDMGSELAISKSVDGENLFLDTTCSKSYDEFAGCTEAYSFVAPQDGVYWITLKVIGDFHFYSAVLPALTPDKHAYADLAVGSESEEFTPGYLNDPESGAYDDVIDQKLFRVTGYKKGDNIVFRTEGANRDLCMRLYDSKGKVLAENLCMGNDNQEVSLAWTATAAYAASSAVYLGVCQQLEDGEVPNAGEVAVSAEIVSIRDEIMPLVIVPDGAKRSPVEAAGVVPSSERTLSATEWVNTFVIAARAGITYRVKAASGETHGLTLGASVYTLSGTTKKSIIPSGSLDPDANGWLEFKPTAHGNVYIDVFVADATREYGAGKGLEYGPYVMCASAAGADLGILMAPMKGAPQDMMGWKILSGPGITSAKEAFYAAGTSAILPAGAYTLVAKEVKGFAKPDAKGYVANVVAGTTVSIAAEYKYTDTSDPLDDSPDAKATEPTTKKKYSPSKLDPKSGKPAVADRTLWDSDPADWFAVAATAGCYYRIAFTAKTGAPKMAVYGPDNWTDECKYVLFDDPEGSLQFCAAKKGTYYVKVSHLDESVPMDSYYSLSASMANPGLVKFAKTAVSVKDSVACVDLSVSRSSKDGVVRVKYRTVGAQTDKDDAYYYPTNGVLTWAANDSKAQTVRVRLVPNSGWVTNKTVQVVLEPFATDDETFDAANEYPATFETDKFGTVLDTATITITASAKKAPGTIQVADCSTPKKPVYAVKAGDSLEIPFERVLGSDGLVGVKIEGSGKDVAFSLSDGRFEWPDGDTGRKTLSVDTKEFGDSDYTASRKLSVKLSAIKSGKNDPVQYDNPTIPAATIDVMITNDKFADTLANYAKANANALKAQGIAIKEGKPGTWFVRNDGSVFSVTTGATLTFSLTGPGLFVYSENGSEKTVVVASGKTASVVVSGTVDSYRFDPPEGAETLLQGVKYVYGGELSGTTVKVASGKLPDGIALSQDKATKAWSLGGVPKKAGYFAATLSTGESLAYDVKAAGTSIGTFNGLATTFDTTNGVASLSKVEITAKSDGKLSAKVSVGGKSYSFADTGYAYVTGDLSDGEPVYVTAELFAIQKVGSGKDVQTLTNWLYYTVMDVAETASAGWHAEGEVEILMAMLPDAKGKGFQEDVWYSGKVYRDNSKSGKDGKAAWEAAMAAHSGYYTVALVAPDAMSGEPRGSGYITLTLDAKGKAKLVGKLADGTTYSASGVAALAGEADSPSVRVPLYAQKGAWVFGGWLSIKAGEDGVPVAAIDSPDTDLVWMNDDPTSTRDGEYGFALYLQPVGGWYDTVASLQRAYLESDLSVDLPEGEDALDEIADALALGDGYAFAAQPSGQAVDLVGNTLSVTKQTLVKDASKKLNDWTASINASNVKLTFKRATGVVSGSFDLWYEGANAKGAFEQKSITGLKHEGVVILSRSDDGYLADDVLSSGFFLAPQKLTYLDAKGKSLSRTWNGSYRFDIKAVDVSRTWTDAEAE